MAKFNGTELTPETIQQTRQWFADNALACIEEATSGKVFVNDLESYVTWRKQQSEQSLAGGDDHTFAFLQRAYFIQTGECIALIPKEAV